MATKLPQNPEEFHSITGVGDHKLRKYGDDFLKEIRDYCNDYGLIPAEKAEASGDREIEPEKKRKAPKSPIRKSAFSELEIETEGLGVETPALEAGKEKALKISSLKVPETSPFKVPPKIHHEVHRLPTKRARYLDMSIQDWPEADSSSGSLNEIVPEGNSPEAVDDIPKTNFPDDLLENGSLETGPAEEDSFTTDSFKPDYPGADSFEIDSFEMDSFEVNSPEMGLLKWVLLK